uniref:(northern house mosquito) hypothetical protein n=1 Tax=Culex pipiens TaxID=7175 RepID=A0A8D8DU14_CULPI
MVQIHLFFILTHIHRGCISLLPVWIRFASNPGSVPDQIHRCLAAGALQPKEEEAALVFFLHTQTLLLARLLFSSRGGGSFTKFRTDPRGKTVPTRRKTLATTGKYHPAMHGAPGHRLALVWSGFERDLAVPKRISTQSGWGGKKTRKTSSRRRRQQQQLSAIKTHVREW